MVTFKTDIQTIEEIKKEIPYVHNLEYFYTDKRVLKLTDKIYKELYTEEQDYIGKVSKAKSIELKEKARIKAIYLYLWSIENITWQMLQFGWNQKDILILIKRMEKAGYNPYSTTENTAAQFIESLPGYGYQERSVNGKTFKAYMPRGY